MKRSSLYVTASAIVLTLLSACNTTSTETKAGKDTALTDKQKMSLQNAETLKKSGNLVEAAKIYEALAREDETSVDAEIELAAIDRKLGRAADAVEVMKDAQSRQPNNANVNNQLGYALIDAGRFEEAVKLFDDVIANDPDNAQALSSKAIAFDKSGNHLAAQELYKQALKIAPQTLSIENNLAMSLILNNQLDHAVKILEKLSRENPDNKTIRHNLALAYGLAGDSGKAYKLNLKDLTVDQARENEKFYSYYAHVRSELQSASSDPNMTIGFTETPDDKKTALIHPDAVVKQAAKAAPKPVVAEVKTTPKPEVTPKVAEDKEPLKPEVVVAKAPKAEPVAKEEKAAASEPDSGNKPDLMPSAAAPKANALTLPPIIENVPEKPKGTVLETSPDSVASEFPSQRRH